MSGKYNEYLQKLRSNIEAENFKGVLEMAEKMAEEQPDSYEAHFFKAVAMSRLISYENQVLADVIKSVHTAYSVLNDEEKNSKREELVATIGSGFSLMIGVILDVFGSRRPSEKIVSWATGSIKSMMEEFKKSLSPIGVNDDTEYVYRLQNSVVKKVIGSVANSWQNIVYKSYAKDTFIEDEWKNPDYRPDEKTMITFAKEAIHLVSLLSFAESNINGTTSSELVYAIYNNKSVISFEISDAKAYKPSGDGRYEVCGMPPEEIRDQYFAISKKYHSIADEYKNSLT